MDKTVLSWYDTHNRKAEICMAAASAAKTAEILYTIDDDRGVVTDMDWEYIKQPYFFSSREAEK